MFCKMWLQQGYQLLASIHQNQDAQSFLDLFCDGCRGQNHNNVMVRFLFTLVFRGSFEKMMLHLPVQGHSFLPCHQHFGVFKGMKQKKDTVQHYKEWEELIQRKYECV